MRHHLLRSVPYLAAALCLATATHATDLTIDGSTSAHRALGTSFTQKVTGDHPGWFVFLATDTSPGPVTLFGQTVPLAFSPDYVLLTSGVLDANGEFEHTVTIPTNALLVGEKRYIAAVETDGVSFSFSNGNELTIEADRSRENTELAGNPLALRPFMHNVRTFNEGTDISVGIDPSMLPSTLGQTGDLYVVAPRDAAGWDANSTLIDLTGDGPNTVSINDTTLAGNRFVVDVGTLAGFDDDRIGVGYDVVFDLDQDGQLSAGDFIDGYSDRAGFYVVHDVTQPGPHAVTETIYNLGSFLGQDLYYPSDIASMGQVPLIIISHGNGHNYQWYDHIGQHMASYGYVVMSHQNNTGPGIQAASTTTLTNTDALLGNLGTIAGGALQGHIDVSQLVWLGHSRGGEGVARAYDRILDGAWTPVNYDQDDIVLISSIAPTDFLLTNSSNPHGANYHLWVGAADSDVSGCATNDIVQSFHLLDRAENQRQSIFLHGVGHGAFHAGSGGLFVTGPCQVSRPRTHEIMRGYFLPLVEYHVHANPAAKDFLTRQWEEFKPIGAPVVGGCVVVDLQFRESAESGKLVLDDFQTNTGNLFASSGAPISFTVAGYVEGRLDDGNSNFTDFPSGTFNGMTYGASTDSTRGCVFSVDGTGDVDLTYTMNNALDDWTGYADLTFRACQITRHPLTTATLGDVTFSLRVTDTAGVSSTISIAAFGGGVEEPYQRTGCGFGTGWSNSFESIRIPLAAFSEGMPELNLGDVDTVAFLFGPSYGSAEARLSLDEFELTNE